MSAAGGMVLAFALSALDELAEPAAAVADAEAWAGHIGVVGPRDVDVEAALENRDIEPDFRSDAGGKPGALAHVRQRVRAERYVYVGTTDEDRELAEALGWEYLSVEEAATEADWPLA